jgi:hypothetical protein
MVFDFTENTKLSLEAFFTLSISETRDINSGINR